MIVHLDNTYRMITIMIMILTMMMMINTIMMMIIIMMMKITKMAITQPILKIGPPDFAWD